MKKCLLLLILLPALVRAADVELTTIPERPLIEVGKSQQMLNFDVVLQNNTREELEVSRFELTALRTLRRRRVRGGEARPDRQRGCREVEAEVAPIPGPASLNRKFERARAFLLAKEPRRQPKVSF